MEKDTNQLNFEIASSFLDNSLKTLENLPKNYENQVLKFNTYIKELAEHENELETLNDAIKIEKDKLNKEKVLFNSLRINQDILENELLEKNNLVSNLSDDLLKIKLKNMNIESFIQNAIKDHQTKLNQINEYKEKMQNHDLKFESYKKNIFETNEQLKNINTMISLLIEKKNLLEKEIPEKFLMVSPEDIKNEIELIKSKTTMIQSSIEDLNIEVQKEKDEIENLQMQKIQKFKMNSLLEQRKSQLKKEIEEKRKIIDKKLELEKKINMILEKLNS